MRFLEATGRERTGGARGQGGRASKPLWCRLVHVAAMLITLIASASVFAQGTPWEVPDAKPGASDAPVEVPVYFFLAPMAEKGRVDGPVVAWIRFEDPRGISNAEYLYPQRSYTIEGEGDRIDLVIEVRLSFDLNPSQRAPTPAAGTDQRAVTTYSCVTPFVALDGRHFAINVDDALPANALRTLAECTAN